MAMNANTIPNAIAIRGPRDLGGAGGGEGSVVITGPDASSQVGEKAGFPGHDHQACLGVGPHVGYAVSEVDAAGTRDGSAQSREKASASFFFTS